MKHRSRRHLFFLLAVAGMLLLTTLGTIGVERLHERRLNALFDGPEVRRENPKGFYSRLEYQLSPEWTVEEDTEETPGLTPSDNVATDLFGTPGKSRGWVPADEIHPEWEGHVEGRTGASRRARLESPTVHRDPYVPVFLEVTYPRDNALFPPNLCSPFIEWGDVNNDLWQVRLAAPDADVKWTFLTREPRWRIPDDVWEIIKRNAVEGDATLEVRGIKRRGLWGKAPDEVHVSRVVRFRVSKDKADDVLVFRLVDPPFINLKTPDMFVRDIREKRRRLFLSARRQYCLNCHTFSSKSGNRGTLGIQVRYVGNDPVKNRVYLALYDIEKHEGRLTLLPFEIQMTTFMGWSPDETKLTISANQKIAATAPIVMETQSVSQPTSDIAVYDRTTNTVKLLPGASDPNHLEIYPNWTPDGKEIVFSAAAPGVHPSQTRYDLYVIPYNDGRGGTPLRVPGAVNNGKSNHYARFSPDGKWMSFVQSNYGSLIKASSEIYIMPEDFTSPPRRLESNVDYAADSWHSWSSNSRWIVFATKRDDGLFARLYMTHIDDEGHASVPVRLPIEEPDMRMSFNIPEFVANMPPVSARELFENVNTQAPVIEVRSREDKAQHADDE